MLEDLIDERDQLSNEKQYLCAIRALKETHDFKLWASGVKSRYDALVRRLESVDPTDSISISAIQAQRATYRYELDMIDECDKRINVIDGLLKNVNTSIGKKTNHGNEGYGLPRG